MFIKLVFYSDCKIYRHNIYYIVADLFSKYVFYFLIDILYMDQFVARMEYSWLVHHIPTCGGVPSKLDDRKWLVVSNPIKTIKEIPHVLTHIILLPLLQESYNTGVSAQSLGGEKFYWNANTVIFKCFSNEKYFVSDNFY